LLDGGGADEHVKLDVDWEAFLSRHDMLWERLPTQWEEGPWFGNGLVGSILHQVEGENRFRLRVFRSDVQEHRPYEYGHSGTARSRLQIGSFYISPIGRIQGCDWRLSLWDAELRGTIRTDAGTIEIRHFVHTEDPVIVTKLVGSGGETGCTWIWEPAEPWPTRPHFPRTEAEVVEKQEFFNSPYPSKVWEPNPDPRIEKIDGVDVCVQDLYHGGEHATAWQVVRPTTGGQIHFASIGKSWPEEVQRAGRDAAEAVRGAVSEDFGAWSAQHYEWWHEYYPASFISLPDTRVETVYWTQIYKLASATRADRPMMDTAGIWQTPSKWPFVTWNLNVQLCYWLPNAANRIDLGMSLIHTIDKYRDNLIQNVRPVEWQTDSAFAGLNTGTDLDQPRDVDGRGLNTTAGNLAWAMHNCWLIYRHTMDKELLRESVFPMLRRAINFQIHLLEERDGRYHLPETISPEYPLLSPDANYELATLRWGCETLLEASRILDIDDPLIPKWRRILEKLVVYPVDDNGYMVGTGVPFDLAHRHYSHLMMVYPYYLVHVEQAGTEELIRKSLDHFYQVNLKEYLKEKSWEVFAAYTHTGLASLYAAIGDGNESLRHLGGFMDYPLVRPNGLYSEAGPVLESPLTAAQVVHDMVLQSWGDKIRVFPAVPDVWEDLVFDDLRAEGAFLVSAERKGGETRWVRLRSLAGEPCRVRPGLPGPVKAVGAREVRVDDVGGGVYRIDLRKGESVLLYSGDDVPDARVAPLEVQPGKANSYGLRREVAAP